MTTPTTSLKQNPAIEINVVDWFTRKGYRFKGTATVFESGPQFDELIVFYAQRGAADAPRRIRAAAMVKVERALRLISPAYDGTVTEAEVQAQREAYYRQIHPNVK